MSGGVSPNYCRRRILKNVKWSKWRKVCATASFVGKYITKSVCCTIRPSMVRFRRAARTWSAQKSGWLSTSPSKIYGIYPQSIRSRICSRIHARRHAHTRKNQRTLTHAAPMARAIISYWVATVSRIDKSIGLLCRMLSLL